MMMFMSGSSVQRIAAVPLCLQAIQEGLTGRMEELQSLTLTHKTELEQMREAVHKTERALEVYIFTRGCCPTYWRSQVPVSAHQHASLPLTMPAHCPS